jgi:hypothetical protein
MQPVYMFEPWTVEIKIILLKTTVTGDCVGSECVWVVECNKPSEQAGTYSHHTKLGILFFIQNRCSNARVR